MVCARSFAILIVVNKIGVLDCVVDAAAYIDAHLREELSVSGVCARYRMSPWELQRAFRALTMDSIGNYIRTRRLSLAADLIAGDENMKMIDVALEVGFGSPEAFTRSFKDHYGVTPLKWRDGERKSVHTKRKPMTEEKLSRLANGIQGPQIIEMPETTFVGMTTEIDSPFARETEFDRRVPNLWLEFNRRRAEISRRETGKGFGLAVEFREVDGIETLTYLASARVTGPVEVPTGMRAVSIPAGTYASFETRGAVESSHATYDYIFGVWLPGSGYHRAGAGHEIEIFDKRFSLEGAEALSTFFVPIERRV